MKLFLAGLIGLASVLGAGSHAHARAVGWWNFDNGTADDLSGFGHHGTLVGDNAAIVYDAARDSNVLSLSGVHGNPDYVSLANPTSTDLPNGSSARTMLAWAKLNTADTAIESILSYGTPATWADSMFIGRWGTELVGGGWNHSLEEVREVGFWDTEWHFIVLTYDGANATLYADWDGANGLKKTEARDWTLTRRNAYIGKQTYDFPCPLGNYEDWNGLIDDAAILDTALSGTDVAFIYNNSLDAFLIPEPSTFVLLCIGAIVLLVCGWRRRRRG